MPPINPRAAAGLRPGAALDAGATRGDDADRLQPAVPGQWRGALRAGDARLAGLVYASGGAQLGAGPLPGRWQHAPGAGIADGGALGAPCGTLSAAGPGFEAPVAPGGYAWWYLDALSDDGQHGLCLIAFIGSVFSPYYASARRAARHPGAAPADAYRHCAVNVSLSGPGGRWAMTERPRSQVQADAGRLQVGASALAWDGEALRIRLDETCSPLPRALRGEVVLRPRLQPSRSFTLDPEGRHLWRPLAPRARVTVQLEAPRLAWEGEAYFDMNRGSRALERDFHGWTWSRAATSTGARVHYEVQHRHAVCAPLALDFDRDGEVHRASLPGRAALPRSGWRIARSTRSDAPGEARVLRTLVDAPFYARSVVQAHFAGEQATCLHESLDLDRFRSRWVQAMLPFRMPRWPLR